MQEKTTGADNTCDANPNIVTAQAWDDSSRLISRTDDNGNETIYQYNPLDRMTEKTTNAGLSTDAKSRRIISRAGGSE